MKYLFTTLFLGFSIVLYTQNTLKGIITDSNDKPLHGVEIYAQKLHKGTTTDLNGNYTLKNLPKGTITIIYSFIGFTTVSKSITIHEKKLNINLALHESVFTMDEVIVSTPFNKLQSENVMKVAHKSIAQLQRQGASTLIEGLSSIVGVSQVSTGTSIGKPVIRGLTGNRVLVYTQGVRLENQQFGDEHGLGLNDAGVESVEIIKGPASLLYGSDALGGVLYFNPEKFANSNSTVSGFNQKYFSNTLGYSSSFFLKSSREKFKFLARMTYNSHTDYQIPNGDRVSNTRFNEYDIKTGVEYSNAYFTSTLRYNYNLLDLGINDDGIVNQTTLRKPTYPKQRVHNHIVSLHNHIFFENSSIDADLGYLFNDRSEFENNEDASLQILLNTLNYTIKYNLPKFGDFESIIGVQGMHQSNTNKADEILIPDATTNDIGAFTTVNYQWKASTIQAGLRFDTRYISTQSYGIEGQSNYRAMIEKRFTSFNASLGYKTNLTDHIITRINLASGFRAPNLAELTSKGVHEGTNRFEIGNSDLKNEQNFQFDLALEYKNKHIEFFANGFYNAIANYIFLSPNGNVIDQINVYIYKQENANLYGGEAGFHLHPHPIDWLHFESSFEMVIGKHTNSYLPLIPAHKINNTLRTDFSIQNWLNKGYASLIVESIFGQYKISNFESSSKNYNLVHFNVGGNLNFEKIKFRISLSAKNIFNTSYISHLSRLKADGIENMGRTFVFGINFEL